MLVAFMLGIQAAFAQVADKELKFPGGKWAIGQVFRLKIAVNQGESFWKPDALIGSAKGTIRVRSDLPLMLVISTEGVGQLDKLNSLSPNDFKSLRLSDLPVTNERLKKILFLKGLEDLICRNTDLNSASLPLIANSFPNLGSLIVSCTEITDAHLDELVKLTALRRVELSQCNVTDVGIKALSKSSSITHLLLWETKITTKCVDDLLKMKQLKFLHLAHDGFDDKSLLKLAALKNLRTVKIGGDNVTEDGIMKFKQRRPDCKVGRWKKSELE